ncbi:response regulator [Pedobacter sp. NJ-S-72]
MTRSPVKVLYIDDEENNLLAFKASFRRQYEIYTAISAAEGLKVLENLPVEVIIADQKMPETTGVEFFQEYCNYLPRPHPYTFNRLYRYCSIG